FTTGAPRTWWVSCGAFFNGMCGFDFLDYGSDTDVQQCGMAFCEAYRNGQNPNPAVSFDSGVYVDGAHDILLYGNYIHGAGIGSQGVGIGSTPNAVSAVAINDEHPFDGHEVANVKIINNIIADATYYMIEFNNTGNGPIAGMEII